MEEIFCGAVLRAILYCVYSCDDARTFFFVSSGGKDTSGATQDREATLNQLLSEMDGFEGKDGIVVMASTNRKVRATERIAPRFDTIHYTE